jgi:hypothetical protein
MQGAGYAVNDVKNFFSNLGDNISNWFWSTF